MEAKKFLVTSSKLERASDADCFIIPLKESILCRTAKESAQPSPYTLMYNFALFEQVAKENWTPQKGERLSTQRFATAQFEEESEPMHRRSPGPRQE